MTTNNFLLLKRQQNAAKRAYFSNAGTTANFASAWQVGGVIGGGLGAGYGGLRQNDDGSQIDPASRLLGVTTGVGAGSILGMAAGSGIPQLMREQPVVREAAQQVLDSTGVNLDNEQLPMSTAERIRNTRARRKRLREQGVVSGWRRKIDPVTGRLEVLAEDVANITKPVREPIGNALQEGAKQAYRVTKNAVLGSPELRELRQKNREDRKRMAEAVRESARRKELQYIEEGLNIANEAKRQELERTGEIAARRNSSKKLRRELDERLPWKKVVDAPGATIEATRDLGVKTVNKAKDLGEQAVSKVKEDIKTTGKAIDTAKNLGQQALDKAGRDIQLTKAGAEKAARATGRAVAGARRFLGFSYMDMDIADFYNPYTTGAAGGAVLGTGIGAGIGLGNSIADANQLEQEQLDQIQAIPDPYARKQEWDIYDDDMSRTGRTLGYGIQGTGNTLASAGVGALGGALLGGAALTGYRNVVDKKFTPLGQRRIRRGDALRILFQGDNV